jgi:ElaB/YqjD/DUF883 family membrane-anchored ribosome-binding protein
MEQTMENGKRSVQKAINEGQNITSNLSERKSEMMGRAQDLLKNVQTTLGNVVEQSSSMARTYPLRSIVLAATGSFILTYLFCRRD